MRRLGLFLLTIVMLAAGFGLGLLATAWVETDWPEDDDPSDAAGS